MKGKRFLSYTLAAALSLSLFAGMAFTANAETLDGTSDSSSADETMQELYDNFKTGFNEDGSVDQSVFDYTTEEESLNTLADQYDSAFDLRHVGGKVTYNEETGKSVFTGGKSYVTPVKFQNPWGTCWAFGIVAASETSILSESGEGTETEENNNIDLSELHLAWFANNHIPALDEEDYGVNDVNDQDGEGMWFIENEGSGTSLNMGGNNFLGTEALAQGVGLVDEEKCPYIGKNGMVQVQRNSAASHELEKTLYYDSLKDWYDETDGNIKGNYHLRCYSSKDDWSVDESERFDQDYVLEEGNILPSVRPTLNDNDEVTLNEDGINAVKAELTSGKGVSVSFMADNSDPNVEVTANKSRYINSNYAHYCWDQSGSDHVVCIVGWDDNYSKDNFGQDEVAVWDSKGRVVYQLSDGSEQQLEYVEDDSSKLYYIDDNDEEQVYDIDKDSDKIEPVKESGEYSTPPGDGAWIVKNSWGNSTNEFPNKEDWGVDGSGYFYISYYDTSVNSLETFDFAVTDEEKEENDCSIVDQYNYMNAASASTTSSTNPVMMANVFTADENMEINAVSCETAKPGTTVTYSICLLENGEDYPSEYDEIAYKHTETYTYGGYHKQILDEPVIVAEGQKYAVIAKETYLDYVDGSSELQTVYSICGNTDYTISAAEVWDINYYSVGVINPKESYIGACGYNSDEYQWTDYYDFISTANVENPEACYYAFDNFSLKAFGNPTNNAAPELESADNTKSGVKVSWESKGDGYNYRLFVRESGTTRWDVVADTDDTSFTVTGLKAGTCYDFTVRCTDDTGLYYITPYNKDGISCTWLPYVSSKVKAASDGINVSWSKVAGASAYNIYRKSGSSGYVMLASVNSDISNYKDSSAKQGVVYTYKVKAFADLNESASNTASTLTLKTPTVKISSTKSKTVTVKWSKNTKATGYQIKYSVGSKIKVVKVKNAATVKKVLKKLKKGKICKVKVRSYKTVSGKTYFSNWSKLKKVKIK